MTAGGLPAAFHFAGSGPAGSVLLPRVFCDGSADPSFREGVDLELSHWIPNRTPGRYKADTSTGICLRYVADPLPGEWGPVVNNHVDTDGILSAFAITHPRIALAHHDVLVQAAGMGDFMGWGEPEAQRLHQTLSMLKRRLLRDGVDPGEIYARAFDVVAALLAEPGAPGEDEQPGIAALHGCVRRIDSGEIRRGQPHERLATWVIPARLVEPEPGRALRVPGFDAELSGESLLLPQARARLDAQRLHLVSSELAAGWFHDVWFPGYAWAETPDSWRPSGLIVESSNAHRLELPAWDQVVAALQRRERGRGRWTLARKLTPFESLRGRGYPVVLGFLRRGAPAPSALPPETVAQLLIEAGVGD